jgi:hypothetical protein
MISAAEVGEKITAEQVEHWFGGELSDGVWNLVSLRIAKNFNEGVLTFTTCDAIMNDLWWAHLERFKGGILPSPFFDVYLAFDAGDNHRRPDRSDDPIGPIGRFVRRIPLMRNIVRTFMFPLFPQSIYKLLILRCPVALRLVRRSFRPQRDFAVLRLFLDREAVFPVSCPAIWPPGYRLLCVLKSSGAQNVRWPRRRGRSTHRQRTWYRSALPS